MATLPEPILIGFFAKNTSTAVSDMGDYGIEEICSVSECMSRGPQGWVDKWKHNTDWWVFDTEQLALSVIEDDPARYDLYAYKLFPFRFDGETRESMEVDSPAQGDLSAYKQIGYDIVSRYCGPSFGHSPLSCNGGYADYPINRYCLLDQADDSLRICAEIAKDAAEKGSWEPGPYCMVKVYRRIRASRVGIMSKIVNRLLPKRA